MNKTPVINKKDLIPELALKIVATPSGVNDAVYYSEYLKSRPDLVLMMDILKEYAEENQVPVRSTSDLSPLEQWLLLKIVRSR